MTKKVLFFDIESHGVDRRWNMEPREFFRLGQYAWGRDGDIFLTEDYDEMLSVIRQADLVVGHNIHAFDLSVLFGLDSTEPLQMALANKVFDTFIHAHLVRPAPTIFTDHTGHTHYDGHKPEKAKRWLSLANLTHQFGLPGKMGDLTDLARKYNPPKTAKKNLDYGLIPLEDPEFREYAEQDVVATRALACHLIDTLGPVTEYHWREQQIAAVCAQMSRNGMKVDIAKAQARVDELAARREVIITDLQKRYGLPTEGKSPWATTAGKEAIFSALAEYGITPDTRPDWPQTATGNPSLGGKEIISLTEGTEAEELGVALAELKGQRSLAQLALDSTWGDGRVHPEITLLQRSGRLSVTEPGLTVWTARGPNAVEKEYFVADEGNVFIEMDYSSADARAVAAVSGDKEFAKRFEPGVDSHDITGEIFWGAETYHARRDELRPTAKAGGHALAYRIGARKLATTTNSTVEEAQRFIDNYRRTYSKVARWLDEVTERGDSGFIENDWGRRMVIDVYHDENGRRRTRAFTQAAALIGQSTTREMMMDTLLRFARAGEFWARSLRAVIHDALLIEVPEEGAEEYAEKAKSMMEATFTPRGLDTMPIDFPVGVGIGKNWLEAGH